jgi:hypothetical protein
VKYHKNNREKPRPRPAYYLIGGRRNVQDDGPVVAEGETRYHGDDTKKLRVPLKKIGGSKVKQKYPSIKFSVSPNHWVNLTNSLEGGDHITMTGNARVGMGNRN